MQDTNTIEYSREAQEALHAQWKASGQSQAAFCREQNIPYNKFSYWHKREELKRLKSAPAFAHAKITNQAVKINTPTGKLVLPNGMRVDVLSEATLLSLIKEIVLAMRIITDSMLSCLHD